MMLVYHDIIEPVTQILIIRTVKRPQDAWDVNAFVSCSRFFVDSIHTHHFLTNFSVIHILYVNSINRITLQDHD